MMRVSHMSALKSLRLCAKRHEQAVDPDCASGRPLPAARHDARAGFDVRHHGRGEQVNALIEVCLVGREGELQRRAAAKPHDGAGSGSGPIECGAGLSEPLGFATVDNSHSAESTVLWPKDIDVRAELLVRFRGRAKNIVGQLQRIVEADRRVQGDVYGVGGRSGSSTNGGSDTTRAGDVIVDFRRSGVPEVGANLCRRRGVCTNDAAEILVLGNERLDVGVRTPETEAVVLYYLPEGANKLAGVEAVAGQGREYAGCGGGEVGILHARIGVARVDVAEHGLDHIVTGENIAVGKGHRSGGLK